MLINCLASQRLLLLLLLLTRAYKLKCFTSLGCGPISVQVALFHICSAHQIQGIRFKAKGAEFTDLLNAAFYGSRGYPNIVV